MKGMVRQPKGEHQREASAGGGRDRGRAEQGARAACRGEAIASAAPQGPEPRRGQSPCGDVMLPRAGRKGQEYPGSFSLLLSSLPQTTLPRCRLTQRPAGEQYLEVQTGRRWQT